MNFDKIVSLLDIVSSFLLSIVAIIITYYLSKKDNKAAQKRLNIELMERYHGIDFYRDIISVVWEIRIKWFNLPKKKRDEYHKEVVLGWEGYSDMSGSESLNHEIPPNFMTINHHLTPIKKDALTEHQALTIYLSFWSTLYQYFESESISDDFISVWKEKYYYNQEFIASLRDAIRDRKKDEDYLPTWVTTTEKLELFFAEKIAKMHN